MKYYIHIFALTHNAEMKATVHRWAYIISNHSVSKPADTNLVLGKVRKP